MKVLASVASRRTSSFQAKPYLASISLLHGQLCPCSMAIHSQRMKERLSASSRAFFSKIFIWPPPSSVQIYSTRWGTHQEFWQWLRSELKLNRASLWGVGGLACLDSACSIYTVVKRRLNSARRNQHRSGRGKRTNIQIPIANNRTDTQCPPASDSNELGAHATTIGVSTLKMRACSNICTPSPKNLMKSLGLIKYIIQDQETQINHEQQTWIKA